MKEPWSLGALEPGSLGGLDLKGSVKVTSATFGDLWR